MKKTILSTCLFIAFATSSVCFAAEPTAQKEVGSGPNPFSDCGIGAALFPGENVKPLAVTSNVIWDIGSTAVTSATASPETCNGKKVEAAAFIFDNYDNLAEETARGMGEHVTALLNIMEVSEFDRDRVVSDVRAHMANAVAADSYVSTVKVDKAYFYYSMLINSLENISA